MSAEARLVHVWEEELADLAEGVRVTRVRAWLRLAVGIGESRSCALGRVAEALPGRADSGERRLRRFVANAGVEPAARWGPVLPGLLARWAGRPVTLVFDPAPCRERFTRLVVGVVGGARALPVAWAAVPQQARWGERLGPVLGGRRRGRGRSRYGGGGASHGAAGPGAAGGGRGRRGGGAGLAPGAAAAGRGGGGGPGAAGGRGGAATGRARGRRGAGGGRVLGGAGPAVQGGGLAGGLPDRLGGGRAGRAAGPLLDPAGRAGPGPRVRAADGGRGRLPGPHGARAGAGGRPAALGGRAGTAAAGGGARALAAAAAAAARAACRPPRLAGRHAHGGHLAAPSGSASTATTPSRPPSPWPAAPTALASAGSSDQTVML